MRNKADAPDATPAAGEREKGIHPCDFRAAGRLSNEDARSLLSLHESFAQRFARAMDLYLSNAVEAKLLTMDQLTLKEYLGRSPFLLVPLSLGTLPEHPLINFDSKLALPIIEILMGGAGKAQAGNIELSELDREIMGEVVDLVISALEETWTIPGISVTAGASIRPEAMPRFCSTRDRLTVLQFLVKLPGASGTIDLILPANFVASLLKRVKIEQPQKKNVWQFPKVPIRERLLDCEVELRAELPELKVAVHDLIALQSGSVLKLRAPIQTPGMLTSGGRPIFEAVPVRNGSQRAAQLGRRIAQVEFYRGDERNG